MWASIGDMGVPVIAGWLMKVFAPKALFWMILAIFVTATTIYALIAIAALKLHKPISREKQEFELVEMSQ